MAGGSPSPACGFVRRDAHAGNPIRIVEANTDISWRSQAEEAREWLAAVVESSEDAIISKTLDGVIIAWNHGAEAIFGYTAAEAVGKSMLMLFPPDRIQEETEILARISRGERMKTFESMRLRKDGERITISTTVSPIKDRMGAIVGNFPDARDITQRRAADEEIRRLNEDLEQKVLRRTSQLASSNRELEAFTYSVSHDLRAPLRHIAGFSKLLIEEHGGSLNPQAQHYLQRIEDGTRRMGQLVDEMLNLARVGRQALSQTVVRLNSLVTEVVAILEPECAGREIEWRIAELPSQRCDPVLTKQVFQNLLANALKFTRPRAHTVIEVSHLAEGERKVILVRDNGVGFDMAYVDKLFGVFQRLHRQEDFEGTGIGLATVQRIVQKHGGDIWAEATPGQGATFYFTLGAGVSPKEEVLSQPMTMGANA